MNERRWSNGNRIIDLHDSVLLEIVSDWSFLVEDVFEFDILLLILSKGTE